MKKALLFVFVLLFGVCEVFGQSWRRVGNWGNDFSGIHWVNNETGYIAGENIFLKSIDGGLSWVEKQSPTKNEIIAFAFHSEQYGLLLGEQGGVFKTSNGGDSWVTVPFNLSGGEKFTDIVYLDADHLVISGTGGGLYLSNDGGTSWQKQEIATQAAINGLYFQDEVSGFGVTSDAEFIKTVDGGQNWEIIPTGFDVELNAVYFTNDSTGYAVGNLGTIIKTIDSGKQWQFINSGIDTDLTAVKFNSSFPLIGVISGKNGTVLRTENGGLTFAEINSRTNQDLQALAFRPESNNVFAVASSGFLISSNNSGNSWSVRLSGRANDYTAVQFTTDLRGYLAGDNGLILLTGNGGNTFTDRSRPISLPFNALSFPTNNAGYVSGNNGNIINTTNSGANWTTLNPGTNRNVNGLYFFNINMGYAVGDLGLITKTEDRGVTWITIPSGETQVNFNDVVFFDVTSGIIIGEDGYIGITEDGANWERIPVPDNIDFNSITIIDETAAIVVGENARVYKTLDKGKTWTRLQNSFEEHFNDVEFLDESVGFIAGDNGLMLRTFDTGENWEKLVTGTYQNFTGISFGDLNVGYAVGENGIFYQYTCQVPRDITTIFGEEDICLSQQIYTIQDLDEEGTTYEWRVDGGSILEGQGTTRVVVKWDQPGRNAIMVRGQNNCGNGTTIAMEVVVSEQPVQTSIIHGEGVVCVNTLEDYYVDSIPGTEYIWQASGGVVRGGQGTANITIEWTNISEQSLSVSTSNPCGEGPTTNKVIRVITIPEQPSNIQGPDRVGIQEAGYAIVGEQDINYQWTAGEGGEIITGQGTSKIMVNWQTEGDHQLQVTPMNACNQGPSRLLTVNVNLITSLEEQDREALISIFPNPSQNDVHLTAEGVPDLQEILIYNAFGQKIREIIPVSGQFVYEIKNLPKGMHLVVLRTRNREYKQRILIN